MLSVRPISMYFVHAASGWLTWSMELLAFASRQFAPKIVNLPVLSFVRILLFFLVSERSGQRKPPAERSALY